MQTPSTRTHPDSSHAKSNLITFNVGGETFTTTYETLTCGYATNSMLSALTSTTLPTTRDPTGRIFIDRDGRRFRVLLNFLRCGTIHVVDGQVPCPGGGFISLEQLEEEAKFYGIQKLVDVIREHIRRMELEHFLQRVYQQRRHGSCQCQQQQSNCPDTSERQDTFTLDAEF